MSPNLSSERIADAKVELSQRQLQQETGTRRCLFSFAIAMTCDARRAAPIRVVTFQLTKSTEYIPTSA
jgi:hypothetical protein